MAGRTIKKDIFRFYPNKISKITATGNLRNGTKVPKPRSGHRIVVDENYNIYSFGGYNPQVEVDPDDFQIEDWLISCPLFRELWKFNLTSKTWVKLKTSGYMPEELASHAAVLLKDKLLVYGGTGVPFGASSSNRVHICDLKTLKWNQIETKGDLPTEQYGQAMALFEGAIYVVGGTTGFEYSMDVHKLDLNTKVWEELLPTTNGKPSERYRHEIAIYNGKIYVFGGGTTTLSFGFQKLPVFDILEKKWEKLKTYPDTLVPGVPLPRRCHGCVKNGPYVIICGGHDGSTVFNDIWKLNLDTMQWTKFRRNLPRPVYFHSTALSPNGQMFVFGGVTSIGEENKRTSNLYSVWLTIPTLKQLAWLALQHYSPNISQFPKQTLLEHGVPMSLLNQFEIDSTNAIQLQDIQAAMP